MDKKTLEAMRNAFTKADEELSKAIYLEESGSNAGIRKINAIKAEWLHWIIYLAGYGFEIMRSEEERAIAESYKEPASDFQKAIEFFKNTKINF